MADRSAGWDPDGSTAIDAGRARGTRRFAGGRLRPGEDNLAPAGGTSPLGFGLASALRADGQ